MDPAVARRYEKLTQDAQEVMQAYAKRVNELKEKLCVDRSGDTPVVVISDRARATTAEVDTMTGVVMPDRHGDFADCLNRRNPRLAGVSADEEFALET